MQKCINSKCNKPALEGHIHGWCRKHHTEWCEGWFVNKRKAGDEEE